jgi:protein OS-9
MEYTGGTECDLTGRQRSTTVQFVCGDQGIDQFISVKEDRSCHYRVVIATPRLCRHPAFAKQLPSARPVRCTPVGKTSSSGMGATKKAKAGWLS